MSRKLCLTGAGIVLLITVVLLAEEARPELPAAFPQNSFQRKITWTVTELSETLFPGTTKTVTVRFRSSQDIQGVTVQVVPSLSNVVSTNPTSFSSILANRDYELILTVSAPKEFGKESFEGTIHLGNPGKPPATYAEPLPVNIKTDFSTFSDQNMTFAYPANWKVSSAGKAITSIASPLANFDSEQAVDIYILFHENPTQLSPDRFFDGDNGPNFYFGATMTNFRVASHLATKFVGSVNVPVNETIVIPVTNGFWSIGTVAPQDVFDSFLTSFVLK
jgi:hypothetical protein